MYKRLRRGTRFLGKSRFPAPFRQKLSKWSGKDALQRARGLKLHQGGLRRRLRRYVHLIVPIMGYALRRADDLSRALEARGLSAPGRRTEYFSPRVGGADVAALVGIVLLAAACIYLRLSGYGELLPRL